MSRLSEIPLKVTYRSDSGNMVKAFYVPCMERSILYRRAVGYFTSSGLAFAAKGVAHLIKNKGRIQLIASPFLNEDDLNAIKKGYDARSDFLKIVAHRTFEEIENSLVKERLNALAWLISEKRMDVKLALKINDQGKIQRGIYHEKIGIFSDSEGNSVAFTGSSNETIGGLIENFESIDVYWSWDDPQLRVQKKINHFADLWENKTQGVTILDFTEITEDLLNKYKTKKPPSLDSEEALSLDSIIEGASTAPAIPNNIELRDYQNEAIHNWFKNNGRGTLKMATGSGKTITALATAIKLIQRINLRAIIIVCPFQHLVTQWARESSKFGMKPLLAFEERGRWLTKLTQELTDISLERIPFLCVITTNKTFAEQSFQGRLEYFPDKTLLIVDEVHNVGSGHLRNALPQFIKYRLGLSATPERWFDDAGTKALYDYFGSVLKPEFTLRDALNKGALVPYRYYPIFVRLTESEREDYLKLSVSIAQFSFSDIENEGNLFLKSLLMKRARLVASAENKLVELRGLMGDKLNSTHMMFYCGDGSCEVDGDGELLRQVDAVSRLLGNELGMRVSTYTAETPLDEREELRERINNGQLQGLVAIRCLDEGVDIPSIRTAFILASSSNPRQFIQRRGRILRPFKDKKFAEIYDMVVIPPIEEEVMEVERHLLKKELTRLVEFCNLALNSGDIRGKILEIQKQFSLLDI